jgi:hypothetical protein
LVIEALLLARSRRLALGVALTGVGLSMRMQSVLALTISAVLGCIVFAVLRKKFPWRIVAVGVASILLASFIELGLRARSALASEIKLQSRITFYTGMFAASPGHSCGRWSRAAVAMAEQDLGKPLFDVVLERGRPVVGVLPSLVFCKLIHYAGFASVGSGWLSASIDHDEKQESATALSLLALTEQLGGFLVKLCMLALIGLGPYYARQAGRDEKTMAWAIPLTILAGYLVVHAFLEIQPRYVLEPLAFVCAVQAITIGIRSSTPHALPS